MASPGVESRCGERVALLQVGLADERRVLEGPVSRDFAGRKSETEWGFLEEEHPWEPPDLRGLQCCSKSVRHSKD